MKKKLQVEYIVVGCGLAGIAFCEQLRKHHKSFVVFDDASQHSSTVAAGIFNPVVLKRFTAVWKATEQLALAMPYYEALEGLLKCKIKHHLKILRKLTSIEEENDWFTASDKPILEQYLSTNLVKNNFKYIQADLGFGEVLQTGRVDTKTLISGYKTYIEQHQKLISESFDYALLRIDSESLQYKDVQAKQIVFAEGFGIKKNPFFKAYELQGTKGEMLIIKAPDLKLEAIIKSSLFIVPLGQDLYWVGATYNRGDKTYALTSQAKKELQQKLESLLLCDYEVVNQVAGIRPTTKDRRPLVGTHSNYRNVHVLNGLGTRGVMVSPYVAEQLYNNIEMDHALSSEIDINRFVK